MAEDTQKAPNPRNARPQARPPEGVGRPKKAAVTRPDSSDTSGLGRVMVRNEFYRDGYRMDLRVAGLHCFVIFGLVAAVFVVILFRPPADRYFRTAADCHL